MITSNNKKGPVVFISCDLSFTFPLSYGYLIGQLKQDKEDVRLFFKRGKNYQDLVNLIMKLNPLFVGIGSLYPELKENAEIIQLFNKAGRRFPIVIGGQMVSPTPEFAVEITGADIGVINEGEITISKITKTLRNDRGLSDIKGLVTCEGLNTGQSDSMDLSKLPPVAYDMFPVDRWLEVGKWYCRNHPQPHWHFEDRVINVHGGRGCPHRCNFCYHHSKPRYRSIDIMMSEATAALKRFNGNMLYFSDDLTLASSGRAEQLVEGISKLYRRVSYSISARFDVLSKMSDDLLLAMKKSGCRIMGLGIESGSDRILKIIGKNCTSEMILNGIERLERVGILPTVSIQVGQFTETKQDAELSFELMRKSMKICPLIQYAFTITTPYPGSPLYDYIFEHKLLKDDREFYDKYFAKGKHWNQVVNLSAMTSQEVNDMFVKLSNTYKSERPKKW